jgi:hypothetical protein
MVDSDVDFIMEVLKDFPVGSNSYEQRMNEISTMLYVTDGFTPAKVKANTDTAVCMITVKDSVKLSFCYLNFDNSVVEIRMAAVHPDLRGNKHFTAQMMLSGYLAYTHCECTNSIQEILSSGTIHEFANLWRPTFSGDETERDTDNRLADGDSYTLKKIPVTAAEHETYRAAHSTWGSITYTVS